MISKWCSFGFGLQDVEVYLGQQRSFCIDNEAQNPVDSTNFFRNDTSH